MVFVQPEGMQNIPLYPVSGGRNLERRFKINWNKNQRYCHVSNCN